ncbi:MAG: AraC family transcriptional regulator [Brachybacterium sp.]|nr:AraC family transcriptional regulator [Brachybacterium sp.]
MDGSTTVGPVLGTAEIPDGFPGERMRVLPRPLVQHALASGPTAQLLVTDAGLFPRAGHHGRTRTFARELIVIQCTAGRGVCEIGGLTHHVSPGQVLVLPPGIPHHYRADEADPWTIWWMHVAGRAVPSFLAGIGADVREPVRDLVEPARVTALLDTVLRRMETDETTPSLVAASGAAWHLLATLCADGRTPAQSRRDPAREIREHLRANLSERITVAEVAALTGYSASHVSALFRRATGFGILEYQKRLRMARARELLDTTDLPISQIAAHVGYEDPLYFSRQFRRIHEHSPSHYRGRGSRSAWHPPSSASPSRPEG